MASGDLHAEVRGFLRKAWRLNNRPDAVGRVIEQLQAAVAQLDSPSGPGDTGFFELEVKRLNALAWRLEDGFLSEFAPTLALALAHGEAVDVLLALAAEVNPSKRNEPLLRRLRILAEDAEAGMWSYWPWLEPDLLEWLTAQQAQGQWNPLPDAALKLLRGLWLMDENRWREALALLSESVPTWKPEALPRSSNVGSALFTCGNRLLSERDFSRAREAFELAIKNRLPHQGRPCQHRRHLPRPEAL